MGKDILYVHYRIVQDAKHEELTMSTSIDLGGRGFMATSIDLLYSTVQYTVHPKRSGTSFSTRINVYGTAALGCSRYDARCVGCVGHVGAVSECVSEGDSALFGSISCTLR